MILVALSAGFVDSAEPIEFKLTVPETIQVNCIALLVTSSAYYDLLTSFNGWQGLAL